MAAFFDIVLSFPTVFFAGAFVIATLYWLMVIVGAADLELIDGVDGFFEGIDGGLEVDGMLDAALDGATEGAAEAAADGAADGVAEAVDGAAGALGPLVFLANVFRLGRIPLTLSLTFFSVGGFLISFVLTWLFLQFPVVPALAFTLGASIVSTVGAAATANLASRPFEPIFKLHVARERTSLIGEVCELSTGRIDARFGQAHMMIDGDDLLFQVRCDTPNTLVRGDRALIVSFDETREAYVVEPLHPSDARQTERQATRLPHPHTQKEG
jgi:hypothetical protein